MLQVNNPTECDTNRDNNLTYNNTDITKKNFAENDDGMFLLYII